nr:hypothetical protein [uncultured Carboxylicivirga sp.]
MKKETLNKINKLAASSQLFGDTERYAAIMQLSVMQAQEINALQPPVAQMFAANCAFDQAESLLMLLDEEEPGTEEEETQK